MAVAGAIVALYSLFEVGASVWEISRGATVFPEVVQVWFDFGHDQVRKSFTSMEVVHRFLQKFVKHEVNFVYFEWNFNLLSFIIEL